MLESTVLLRHPRVAVVRCAGHHSAGEPVTDSAVVLVQRGVFVRRVDGRAEVADVTSGYLQRPGEWQSIDHPRGGDLCTSVRLPFEAAERLAHAGRVRVTAAADLAHRRLLAAHPADRADLVADLIASLLPPGGAGPPPHPLIERVRELLHTAPGLPLAGLAAAVGWSPWHLSRSFHRATGSTLNAYRRRLRVRAALDELASSPRPDLAATALRAGFADQAHMTRAVRAETGLPPAALLRRIDHSRQTARRVVVQETALRRLLDRYQ